MVAGASNSLFRIRLAIPMEYMPMINDLLRMSCIQLVAQYMFYMVNSEANPFFSVMFLQTICFLLLGVLVYWLIITKLFSIETTDTPPHRKKSDSPTIRRKITFEEPAATGKADAAAAENAAADTAADAAADAAADTAADAAADAAEADADGIEEEDAVYEYVG